MPTTCRPLTEDAEPSWDRFVATLPQATFFHRAGWRRVFEKAFGLSTHYTYAERDGAIVGVLPLVHMRSRLFGNTLGSTPFLVEGGAVAEDVETARLLEEHATELRDRLGATSLEMRGPCADPEGWIERADLYVNFRKPISGDSDANMAAIRRKQRAMIRKGLNLGLASTADHDADTLHRVYAESVHALGTPVFPRRYFRLLCQVFGEDAEIVTIRDGEAPVASVLSFYHRDMVMPYYGGGTAAARLKAGNDVMYWEVMRRGAERGCRVFDFGRSKVGTGAYDFKANWGFTPEPLRYRYRLRPGAALPNLNPTNPKYRLVIEAWKRLPLPVANAIGPFIARNLG